MKVSQLGVWDLRSPVSHHKAAEGTGEADRYQPTAYLLDTDYSHVKRSACQAHHEIDCDRNRMSYNNQMHAASR